MDCESLVHRFSVVEMLSRREKKGSADARAVLGLHLLGLGLAGLTECTDTRAATEQESRTSWRMCNVEKKARPKARATQLAYLSPEG